MVWEWIWIDVVEWMHNYNSNIKVQVIKWINECKLVQR